MAITANVILINIFLLNTQSRALNVNWLAFGMILEFNKFSNPLILTILFNTIS